MMNKIMAALAVAFGVFSALAAETVELKAKPTVTPVELNFGDTVKFTLLNGETRTIRLVDTSAQIIEIPTVEGLVYMFDVTLEVDGHRVKIDRYTATQQAFYEPIVINGMRIWADMALSVYDVIPMRYPGTGNQRQRPWKDMRLALQDATIEDCPVKLSKWFDYRHPSIFIGDCYHGGDCWMGSFGAGVAHGGLDVNQREGDPLWAPMDFDDQGYFQSLATGSNNNRWRGWRTWPDGSIWAFQCHHVITQYVAQGMSVKQGTHLFDGAGVWVGWYNHNHYEFKVANGKMPDWNAGGRNSADGRGGRALEHGQPEVYHLDPWIYFRQIFRNEREKTGYVYPEMAPPGPAKTAEAVVFELTKGGSDDVYWDFGDGAFGRGAKVTHRYAKPGLYAARAVIVREDGSLDEVIRHLTVNGAASLLPSLIVQSDDHRFRPWPTGTQYAFGYDLVNYRPGGFEIKAPIGQRNLPTESRTFRFANAGGGVLPPIAAALSEPCDWIVLQPTADGVTFTVDPMKAKDGVNEAAIVLKGEGLLNGEVTVPVRLAKVKCGYYTGSFRLDSNAHTCFYATPGFWCSHRLSGSKRYYKMSGNRPESDAIARFIPEPMAAGTYRVRVDGDAPWAAGSKCWVDVKDAAGLHRVRFEPAKSWTVGTFRFAAGGGNYVEFRTQDSVGSVAVNHLAFDRLPDTPPVAKAPYVPETIELKAKPTVTPVEMNCGDVVKFTLLNGATRTLTLIGTSARMAACTTTETILGFDATLEIDGHRVTFQRNTCEPEAFYEPFVVNGLRIWPDMALKIFDVMPMRQACEGNGRRRPWKDLRLALQDATIEDCPVKLSKWLEYPRLAPSVNDGRVGGMCWMGSFEGHHIHGGLDIRQQPDKTALSAPLDLDDQAPLPERTKHSREGRWRGIRKWDDGSVWAFECHHIVTQSVPAHVSVKQGTTFLTGGKPHPGHHMHTHFEFRVANNGMPDWDASTYARDGGAGTRALEHGQPAVYHLDPWIYFRQIFRNERERTGYEYPELAPIGPAKTGEAVAFEVLRGCGTATNRAEVCWDFGDGAFGRGEKVTHRYAKPGIYAARAVFARPDGTFDEVVRHLTVDGTRIAVPDLVVKSDEPAFFPHPAGVPQAFAYGRVNLRPGQFAFITDEKRPSAETRTLRFANAGGGVLPKVTATLKTPCDWLTLASVAEGVVLTADGTKAPAGVSEAVIVLAGDNLLNGAVEVPVRFDVGAHTLIKRDRLNLDASGVGFYATPGGWLGLAGGAFTSGGRNRPGEVARFTPQMLEAGEYTVCIPLNTPWPMGHQCNVRVRDAGGVQTVRFDPAKSMTLGTFRFAAGGGNYIEFESAGATGEVVVRKVRLIPNR